MLFGRRSRNSQATSSIDEAALLLETRDEALKIAFPHYIVSNIRQMVSRIEARNTLPKRLAFSSALQGEGVTFTSWATATLLANDFNQDVCVVDLNWWDTNELIQADYDGLSSVLQGNRDINDVLVTTNYPNLVLLPAGTLPVNERPIASRSEMLGDILNNLDERFDHLILDLPPILSVSESVTLVARADACCMVVRQGVTSSNNVRKALDEMEHLQVLGVVMNQVKTVTPDFLLQILPIE